MDNKDFQITSRQLSLFVLSSKIGTGIIYIPHWLAIYSGHCGWICVLISGIISTFLLYLIIILLKRYKNKSIFEINNVLFGKYIAWIINILLCIYLFIIGSFVVRNYVDIVSLRLLPRTPPIVLTLSILLTTIYLIYSGLKYICRYENIIFLSIFSLLFLCLIIIKDIKITFLLPLFNSNLVSIASGIFISFYAFLGFEVVAFVYPYVVDKENVTKSLMLSSFFLTFFLTFMTFVLTGFFGENMIKHLVLPIITLTGSVKFPVFESLDIYFILSWTPVIACSYYGIKKLFNIEGNFLLIIFTIIFVALSRIFRDFLQVEMITRTARLLGISVVLYMILCLIISLITKKGVKV